MLSKSKRNLAKRQGLPNHAIAAGFFFALSLASVTRAAVAQSAPSGDIVSAEQLTMSLVALNAQYRSAGAAEQPRILSSLVNVAASRALS